METQINAALEDAYRFITQPTRVEVSATGAKTATYPIENYNALTAKLRAALALARGETSHPEHCGGMETSAESGELAP